MTSPSLALESLPPGSVIWAELIDLEGVFTSDVSGPARLFRLNPDPRSPDYDGHEDWGSADGWSVSHAEITAYAVEFVPPDVPQQVHPVEVYS